MLNYPPLCLVLVADACQRPCSIKLLRLILPQACSSPKEEDWRSVLIVSFHLFLAKYTETPMQISRLLVSVGKCYPIQIGQIWSAKEEQGVISYYHSLKRVRSYQNFFVVRTTPNLLIGLPNRHFVSDIQQGNLTIEDLTEYWNWCEGGCVGRCGVYLTM